MDAISSDGAVLQNHEKYFFHLGYAKMKKDMVENYSAELEGESRKIESKSLRRIEYLLACFSDDCQHPLCQECS